jgi:hypothetical protein
MTKNIIPIVLIIAVLEIALLIGAGMYIQGQTANLNVSLSSVYASRKSDLIAQQQKLDLMIADLNTTLQSEIANNAALSSQLAVITGTSSQSTQTPTPIVQQPSNPVVQQPTPAPVTRAS